MKLTLNVENRKPLVDLVSRFVGKRRLYEDADLRLPDRRLHGDARWESGSPR